MTLINNPSHSQNCKLSSNELQAKRNYLPTDPYSCLLILILLSCNVMKAILSKSFVEIETGWIAIKLLTQKTLNDIQRQICSNQDKTQQNWSN